MVEGTSQAVKDAGLDSHSACARTPHAQRPGTLLRYLRARQDVSGA